MRRHQEDIGLASNAGAPVLRLGKFSTEESCVRVADMDLGFFGITISVEQTLAKTSNVVIVLIGISMVQLKCFIELKKVTQSEVEAFRTSSISIGLQLMLDMAMNIASFSMAITYSSLFAAFVILFVPAGNNISGRAPILIRLFKAHDADTFRRFSGHPRRLTSYYMRAPWVVSALPFTFLSAFEEHAPLLTIGLFSIWIPQIVCTLSKMPSPISRYALSGGSLYRGCFCLYTLGLSFTRCHAAFDNGMEARRPLQFSCGCPSRSRCSSRSAG